MNKKKIIIYGPNKLSGDVKISGSKNSALPILFASILSKEDIKIKNIPNIEDINITIKILKNIGIKIIKNKNLLINAKYINNISFKYNLIKKIRASIWLIGPILIRCKKIKLNKPGGCNIGKRPIDMHIYALKSLGAKINYKNNKINIFIKKKLNSNIIKFPKISVGATITSILTSVLIPGITTIYNIAKEPEIIDTINFLNKIGAKIKKTNKNKLIIKGVKKLTGGTYKIIPDRIETGTYLIAGAISKSKITCYNTNPIFIKSIIKKLILSGAKIKIKKDFITLNMNNKKLKPVNIITNPYPGFPTDMQPQFTLLNSIALGKSYIKENIFPNRFLHIKELNKMGTNIKIKNNKIICIGVNKILGNNINATDLRSSACLILAGCIANGNTIINSIHHIYRGYENVLKKLTNIGAKIKILNNK